MDRDGRHPALHLASEAADHLFPITWPANPAHREGESKLYPLARAVPTMRRAEREATGVRKELADPGILPGSVERHLRQDHYVFVEAPGVEPM